MSSSTFNSISIEHSKHYLVNIQVFGDRFSEIDPTELNYLATSVEIDQTGGSEFVHQKGRNIASSFSTQPTVSVSVRCFMTDVDFAVLISAIITEQQQILLSVGRLEDISKNINSKLMFEAIGYLNDAKISAISGEFVIVDFVMNADDIKKIRMTDIPEFR